VTANRDRQRAAARARLEQEMTKRAEAASRRRRSQAIIGGAVGIVLVITAVVFVVVAASGGKKKKPTASAKSSASASASATASPTSCTWNSPAQPSGSPEPLPSTAKDVGTPPATGEPRKGGQTMTITTNLGVISVAIDDAKTPCTAASFTYLASKKFFDNTPCHRMTTKQLYVLQCGDPSGTGSGGPTYHYDDENLPVGKRPAYPEGVIAMANSGPGTNSSQFFIVYKDTDVLQPDYTVLGRVTQGLDIVKKVAEAGVTPADPSNPDDGKPKTAVTIVSLTMSPTSAG
jgi:peptidyl-prolyl cis-trans isomerase B (cyclophilin B)